MNSRTIFQNIDLIDKDHRCPNCLHDVYVCDEWTTSLGESSSTYYCDSCGSEFTITHRPPSGSYRDSYVLDSCIPEGGSASGRISEGSGPDRSTAQQKNAPQPPRSSREAKRA